MTVVSVTPAGPSGVSVSTAGPRGKGWQFGVGAPTDDIGFNGEMYLDVETFNAYGPKVDGTWAGTPIADLTGQADLAQAAQADAEAARDAAEEWAIKPEDSPVSVEAGGNGVSDFSARHHARKAAASASDANEGASLAQAWAERDENVAVEPGKYSAKHHALKAAASAAAAATFDPANFYDRSTSDDRFLGKEATAADSATLNGKADTEFATAVQGGKADTALQPEDVGALARKDKVSIPGDFNATGTASGSTFLAGDNTFKVPSVVFTQIASVTASGPAVTFNSLPQDYGELLAVFTDVTQDSGSNQTLRMEASADGTSFSSAQNISASGAGPYRGDLNIVGHPRAFSFAIPSITAAAVTLPSTPSSGTTSTNISVYRHTGGMKSVRFSPASGNFNGGTITLFAR